MMQQEEQADKSSSSTSSAEARKRKRRAPSKKELEKKAKRKAKKLRRQGSLELGQRRRFLADWSDEEVGSVCIYHSLLGCVGLDITNFAGASCPLGVDRASS
jgi:hypothetical protein